MPNANGTEWKKILDINASLGAELVFTFIPFLVTIIVLIYKGGSSEWLYIPAWSLAASVLSGKTIVKFFSGVLPYGKRLYFGTAAFMISLLFVILFTSLAIHILILISPPPPPLWLGRMQIAFFVISVVSFLFLGRVSQEMLLINDTSSE